MTAKEKFFSSSANLGLINHYSLFCKDQEVIQQGSRRFTTRSRGYTTRIRRLYNTDQKIISSSQEMLCLLYAGFFVFCLLSDLYNNLKVQDGWSILSWICRTKLENTRPHKIPCINDGLNVKTFFLHWCYEIISFYIVYFTTYYSIHRHQVAGKNWLFV